MFNHAGGHPGDARTPATPAGVARPDHPRDHPPHAPHLPADLAADPSAGTGPATGASPAAEDLGRAAGIGMHVHHLSNPEHVHHLRNHKQVCPSWLPGQLCMRIALVLCT